MSAQPSISDAMERISRWFEAHAPEHAPEFAPPVSGVEGALQALYEAVGGQTDHQDVFDYHSLLTPDDAVRERKMMDELARTEPWEASWWQTSWVPFASDFAGQLLVVDEHTGEVIRFIHDDHPRPVLAPSLAVYFDGIAADLESGARVFDERVGVVFAEDLERLLAPRARLARGADAPSPLGFYVAALAFGLLVMVVAFRLGL